MARLKSLQPMLSVEDLERTISFYRDKLGFIVCGTFGVPSVWCHLQRDGVDLMFNQPGTEIAEAPRRAKDFQIYYIYSDDVRALHADLVARGLAVSNLRITPYRKREFELRDPDGYWLWFGEDTSDPPTNSE